MHNVLIVGGYGFFGQRISAALARNPYIRLFLGGRDLGKAATTAKILGLRSEQAIAIDVNDANFPRRSESSVSIH